MSASRDRRCYECKFMLCNDDYYSGISWGCEKGHWPFYRDINTPAALGDALKLAATCEDFKERPVEESE